MSRARLANRAVKRSPIKAPAMNITLGTGGVLSLGAALTTWKESFEFLFEVPPTDAIRAQVLIATIAAIVVVAAADMFSRAISARQDPHHVLPWGAGWTAAISQPEADDPGYIVAGMRTRASQPDAVEYLLVKAGSAPVWKRAADVTLAPPAEE